MYLGLDLGTSGLKGLLVSASGQIIGSASASYPVSQPHRNWSEQEPDDWVVAVQSVFATLRAEFSDAFANVKAISLSGHMHGAVTVDRDGNSIRPCILWNDTRSATEASALDATPVFRAISGNIAFPGFTAPKLMWMKKHEPENFSRIHKVMLPKDYLLKWFTGRYVTDVSDAAATGWLDVAKRDWSAELLAAGGMRLDQMPDLVEACEGVGVLRSELANEFGFDANVLIVAGGADNAVAACGVGVVREGQGFVSLGTSGVMLAARDGYMPAPETAVHTFCHALPARWYQMGVALSATNSLNWLSGIVGMEPAELATLCGPTIDGPSKITFLPYLSGERTPHNDSEIGGAFVGLKQDTTRSDMAQAVMEGVCFAQRDCLEALRSTGADFSELLAIGGGTNSAFWLDSLASILNLPLLIPDKSDFGAALGAARLAMIGDGADQDAVLTSPKIARVVEPNAQYLDQYEAAYQRYRKLYPLVKEAT
jgi:xylulokinase